jgi:hypothetical protein
VSRATERRRADLAERMVPVAAQLVGAVHDDGPDEVAAILRKIRPQQYDALAVVLAAMVDPELTPAELLAWVQWDEPEPGYRPRPGNRRALFHVPDEVREGHAAFGRAKAHGEDPEPFRELEREYQRIRAQHRRARQQLPETAAA